MTDDAAILTRSEEQLRVRTERVATERVRLEKFIVTEERTITVSVRREEVRLVREDIEGGPVVEADVAASDRIDLVLSEEQVMVTKRIVPIERVRLERLVVTEDQVIEAGLRSERIDVSTV